jgi:hypothetical protein
MAEANDASESRLRRYRQEAEGIRQEAGSVTDPSIRQHVLDLANQYDQLADSIERARFG